MPGIRDYGQWKQIQNMYIKDSSIWKEVIEVHQKYNGEWRLIWTPSEAFIVSGTNEEIKLRNGSYIVSGNQDITLTSVGSFKAEVLMWGEGAGGEGGYTKGIIQFKRGIKYRIITGAGGGLASTSDVIGYRGGGYAGLFEGSTSNVSATHTQALLIAGGAGGKGESLDIGGGGGGLSGGNGTGTGFGEGATQTSGPGGILKGEDAIQRESVYTTPGSYIWTCPDGVTSVSVLCIGGGGGGDGGNGQYAGGGGELRYKNNIPVVPGQSYTVVVGKGGNAGYGGYHTQEYVNSIATSGENSYFINTATVRANGGGRGSGGSGGIGDGGGNGGSGGSGSFGSMVNGAGGGGAGGYSGNGGNGTTFGFGYSGSGGGGGGGAAGQGNGTFPPTYDPPSYVGINAGFGGGTNIYGEGANGSFGTLGNPGRQGSGENEATLNYGGGGGMGIKTTQPGCPSPYCWSRSGTPGGSGAVRIIWGENREFPNNAERLPPGLSGGGAGYYGGGGSKRISFPSGGGGGGSGYVNTSKVLNPRITSTFDNASDPDRGDAGSVNYGPARVVIRLI